MEPLSDTDGSEQTQKIKVQLSRVLDQIEASLTSAKTRVRPRGTMVQEDIMHHWAKLMHVMIFMQPYWRNPQLLDRAIELAKDAVYTLEYELRIPIPLRAALESLSSAMDEKILNPCSHSLQHRSMQFVDAVRTMQNDTGIAFDLSFMDTAFSLPVLAHLSAKPHPNPEVSDSVQCTPSHYTGASSDIVLIGSNTNPTPTYVMEHVCHECAVALKSHDESVLGRLAQGVLWSDSQLGLSAISHSTVHELGAVMDDTGENILLAKGSGDAVFATLFGNESQSFDWETEDVELSSKRDLANFAYGYFDLKEDE